MARVDDMVEVDRRTLRQDLRRSIEPLRQRLKLLLVCRRRGHDIRYRFTMVNRECIGAACTRCGQAWLTRDALTERYLQ